MSNLCQRTAVGTAVSGAPVCGPNQWSCNSGLAYVSGATQTGTSSALWIPVNGAFDADQYGITCQAFSNAAVSITSLQTQLSNMQTQMTAYISGNEVRAPNPEILQSEALLFGVVLTAAAGIWGLKRVLNLFRESGRQES